MKTKLFLLIALFFSAFVFSQINKVYFGIPKDSLMLKIREEKNYRKFEKGDRIISNLPLINYNRGSFYENNYVIDDLVRFLNDYKKFTFKIKIFKCSEGNKEFNNSYNWHLGGNLKQILYNKSVSNFIINENDYGTCDDTLIKDKESPYYFSSGSFLEITVQ